MRYLILLAALGLALPGYAATSKDVDRLTTLAVMYGRAIGCGLPNTDAIGAEIGRWMDRRFPPGSADQKTYMPVFINGVTTNAQAQASGRSPDSCASVSKFFQSQEYRSGIR